MPAALWFGRSLLIALCLVFTFKVGALACGEEVVDGGELELCSGSNCQNGSDCPADAPADGDSCTQAEYGNCHYCEPDSNSAEGYTCDGSSWSSAGTFDCS